MCPVCIATAAWIAAGVGSTGGISALVVSRFRSKNQETANNENQENGETHDSDKY
jgi:hypothetical protein